ncbi:substrate-binding domain-containing protein [Frigoribacterium sp. 2-23]|uniref:LacI family DNA-binding transcriptional regulator n=1 Tax=Frigoribacterium sp. 2-23 TaxID=3415006 RepID=UPI003C6FFF10
MATIFDVASEAGVSHQTVSRVVNGDPTVRPATRERVDAAILKLRYRPSAAARALASRRAKSIGLVGVGFPFYGPSSIMHGFNGAARSAGFQVSMATLAASVDTGGPSRVESMRDAIEALLGQDVAAIVLIAPDTESIAAAHDLQAPVPVITADGADNAGSHAVSIDQAAGAALAVEHLAALGHRGVAHVAGPTSWHDGRERERGWREACERLGLAMPDGGSGDWTPESGYRAGNALVDRARSGEITAVFCANDQMALGVLHAFSDAGVAVPGDVSVVGFDDLPEAAYFIPPLTTVRQDFEELGRRIMAVIEDVVAGGAGTAVPTVPELVVRGSTAPPRV